MPVPTPMSMRNMTRSPVEISGDNKVKRPQEMTVTAQPIQTVTRNRSIMVVTTPAIAAEGAVVNVIGRASTPDWSVECVRTD